MKTRTSILIETQILKTAQNLGINISKACENALILYVNAIQNANQKITSNHAFLTEKGSIGTVGSDPVVRSPGFEPGIASLEDLSDLSEGKNDSKQTISVSPFAKRGSEIRHLEVIGLNPTLDVKIKQKNGSLEANENTNIYHSRQPFEDSDKLRYTCQKNGIPSKISVDWNGFKDFMFQRSKSAYAKYCVNYAQKYAHCLLNGNFSEIQTLPKTVRGNVIRALANLSKYLGIYPQFQSLMRSHAIEWGGKSSDQIVIERLTKTKSVDEVFEWIREVKKARSDLAEFMDFMAVSGMRLVEAIASYNLIIELAKKNRLSEYYNEEKEALEHYKFKDTFLRRSKKVFISFIPKELVQRITLNAPLPNSRYAVEERIRKRGLPLRFSDIREVAATFLTKYLRREEIDFIQGRVTSNVFMENYFNPNLISDLKERVFKAVDEICQKIR